MSAIDHERVLEFFHQHPERPWHVQDVQKRLGVEDRAALQELLDRKSVV